MPLFSKAFSMSWEVEFAVDNNPQPLHLSLRLQGFTPKGQDGELISEGPMCKDHPLAFLLVESRTMAATPPEFSIGQDLQASTDCFEGFVRRDKHHVVNKT